MPVLHFTKDWLNELRRELPELPAIRKQRFISEFALIAKDATTLVGNKELADYFEQVVSELDAWLEADNVKLKDGARAKYIKLAANWSLGQFSALLNEQHLSAEESKVTPENFAELIKLIGEGKVSQLSAKDVFVKMFQTGEDPSNILDDLGLHQVSDETAIREAVQKVLAANPKGVADAKTKGERAFGFLVGQTMKELKGQGNPVIITEVLKKELNV